MCPRTASHDVTGQKVYSSIHVVIMYNKVSKWDFGGPCMLTVHRKTEWSSLSEHLRLNTIKPHTTQARKETMTPCLVFATPCFSLVILHQTIWFIARNTLTSHIAGASQRLQNALRNPAPGLHLKSTLLNEIHHGNVLKIYFYLTKWNKMQASLKGEGSEVELTQKVISLP